MIRHGLRPSNDKRWTKLASIIIERAEDEDVEPREFYCGLVAIMDELEDRLSAADDELTGDE